MKTSCTGSQTAAVALRLEPSTAMTGCGGGLGGAPKRWSRQVCGRGAAEGRAGSGVGASATGFTAAPPLGGHREVAERGAGIGATPGHTQVTYWLDSWARLRGAHMWRPDAASRPPQS